MTISDIYYTWVAVRCCCTPKKVFGFVRLPKVAVDGAGHRGKVRVPLVDGTIADVELRMMEDYFRNNFEGEVAIYSEDRPLRFWRTVCGFVEAVEQAHPSLRDVEDAQFIEMMTAEAGSPL